jgi:hypothetical protein
VVRISGIEEGNDGAGVEDDYERHSSRSWSR